MRKYPNAEKREAAQGVFTDDLMEFVQAIESLKKEEKIRFLTHTDYLRVLKKLGYKKIKE
ncbi:MAG: hypothetical protein GY845_25835 [Planctomycetes bacterium]|nr:hypothetical protein [Planctomycetota bacterium]